MGSSTMQPVVKLRVGRSEAKSTIKALYDEGQDIQSQPIQSKQDLEKLRSKKTAWARKAAEKLLVLFDGPQPADGFNSWHGPLLDEHASLGEFVEQFNSEVKHRMGRLTSLYKRLSKDGGSDIKDATRFGDSGAGGPTGAGKGLSSLSRLSQPPPSSSSRATTVPPTTSSTGSRGPKPAAPAAAIDDEAAAAAAGNNRVVIALYTDDEARGQRIGEFLGSVGLTVSLVNVGAGHTKSLVNDIDSYGDLCAAILLIDDESDAAPREFELGFCAGRLGANRVYILHTGKELPPDRAPGLTHVPIDAADGWQLHLARHMRRAGVEIDLNKII